MRPCFFGLADESVPFVAVAPIQISADWCQEWRDGETTIALFRGSCRVVQGERSYAANNMVVWTRDPAAADGERQRLTAYLEDAVEIREASVSRTEQSTWVDLDSAAGMTLTVRGRAADRSGADDP